MRHFIHVVVLICSGRVAFCFRLLHKYSIKDEGFCDNTGPDGEEEEKQNNRGSIEKMHSLTEADVEARYYHFGGNVRAVMDGRPMDLGLRLDQNSWEVAERLLRCQYASDLPKGWNDLVHISGLPPDYTQYRLSFASRFVARTIVGRAWLEGGVDIAGWLATQEGRAIRKEKDKCGWQHCVPVEVREQVEDAYMFCQRQLREELCGAVPCLPTVLIPLVIRYIRRP
jgi:hypothetical protein